MSATGGQRTVAALAVAVLVLAMTACSGDGPKNRLRAAIRFRTSA